MTTPLVSIIIPVYNRERHIGSTIESVLSQSYKNLEIIIVNDGSTDRSLDIMSLYAKKDSRIRIFNKKNRGVSAAREFGLQESKGEYFFFFDADDLMTEFAIERLVGRAVETSAEIVTAKYITRNFDHDSFYEENPFDIITGKDYLRLILTSKVASCLWIRLYRYSLYTNNRIQFHNDISFGEDTILTAQFFYYSTKVAFLDSNVVIYNRTDDSMTALKNINRRKLLELHSLPYRVRDFLESERDVENFLYELNYLKLKNIEDMLTHGMFDFVYQDFKELDDILKLYPCIKNEFPRYYIKLIRLFNCSKILWALYFWGRYKIFPIKIYILFLC